MTSPGPSETTRKVSVSPLVSEKKKKITSLLDLLVFLNRKRRGEKKGRKKEERKDVEMQEGFKLTKDPLVVSLFRYFLFFSSFIISTNDSFAHLNQNSCPASNM